MRHQLLSAGLYLSKCLYLCIEEDAPKPRLCLSLCSLEYCHGNRIAILQGMSTLYNKYQKFYFTAFSSKDQYSVSNFRW